MSYKKIALERIAEAGSKTSYGEKAIAYAILHLADVIEQRFPDNWNAAIGYGPKTQIEVMP